MNIFQGIVSGDEHPILEWPGGKIIIPTELFKRGKESYRGRVLVGIRPHDLHWACRAAETAICKVDATVEFVEALGSEDHITVNIDGSSAVCVFPTMSGKKSSDPVSLACDPCRFHLFEPEEEGGEVVGGPSLGWQSNTPLVDNVESMSVAPAANPQ